MRDLHDARRRWFGHPPGLTILFLTEAWEKFSFFGMRALLVYYMTSELAFEQDKASLVYGFYTGAIFLTPLFGALVSDRWLGRRRAIIAGGLIMTAGHGLLAIEAMFYGALAIIAIGSGLFVPNLPSQIASLYRPTDARRQSAYNIYYVGINLGGMVAPLVCGTIGELYGWHWGFMAAGGGMVAGLVIYLAGGRHLPPEPGRVNAVGGHGADAAPVAGAGTRPYRLLAGIALAVIIFRAAYEQLGNTIAIWTEHGVDRSAYDGFTIPMTWFQSLNPLLVFVLTPLLLSFWARLAATGREPAPMRKMAFGAALAASAYLLLAAISIAASGEGATVWWPWVALFFLVMTTAELCLFPVGLALFAEFAPRRGASTAIAAWFLTGFAGNIAAGAVGSLWSAMPVASFFVAMATVAGIAALMFLGIERGVARSGWRAVDRPVSDLCR